MYLNQSDLEFFDFFHSESMKNLWKTPTKMLFCEEFIFLLQLKNPWLLSRLEFDIFQWS